jgi:hypothetical protein
MRKFAVTTFAVLYGMLVLSASAERWNDWAAREAPERLHFAFGHHCPCLGKMEKSDTRLRLIRIIGREFVVESPREAAGVPTCSQRHRLISSCEDHATWTSQPFSPRAPPFRV